MAALTIERKTPKLSQDVIPSFATNVGINVEASTKIYAGGIVIKNAAGNAAPGTVGLNQIAVGVAEKTVDNSAGIAGALTIVPRQGVFALNSGTSADAITAANVGADCYIIDDNTVGLTNGSGTRSRAGQIVAFDGTNVWVLIGLTGSTAEYNTIANKSLPAQAGQLHTVRGLVSSNVTLATFTVAGNDGLTYAANDRVLLTGQTLGAQNGIYVVGTVAAGVAPLVLALDWTTAAVSPQTVVAVSEGTVNAGTLWALSTAAPITVATTALTFTLFGSKQLGAARQVRGVCTTAETLATFDSVAGGTIRDGVTYVAGDRVLLVNQATKSQNGVYIVGTVAAGAAPLTRAPDFATGMVLPAGVTFEVSEGTLFANTTWKITTAGAITIDTTNFDAYPRSVTQSVTLVAGTLTAITTVPILSATKTNFAFTRTVPNTCLNTIYYAISPIATPGIAGTASMVPMAQVAAGTINAADVSTLLLTVNNW